MSRFGVIVASRAGICAFCSKKFSAGVRVYWDNMTRRRICQACGDHKEDAAKEAIKGICSYIDNVTEALRVLDTKVNSIIERLKITEHEPK